MDRRFTFRLDLDLASILLEHCIDKEMTVSEFIRLLLIDYFGDYENV